MHLIRKITENAKLREMKSESSERSDTFSFITWNLFIVVCIIGYSSYSILVNLSKVNNNLQYSSAFLYFLIEIIKLSTSLSFWAMEGRSPSSSSSLPTSTLPTSPSISNLWYALSFGVPAVLYCLTNNIAVHLQLEMDPATYQVLCNLKILSTALLYRVIIKKVLTLNQWVALFILFLSACFSGLGGIYEAPPSSSSSSPISQRTYVTVKGLFGILAYTLMSGMAGVYNECILKKHKEVSINIQNSLLYTYGVFLNCAVWLYHRDSEAGTFEGFNMYVWMIVVTQSFIGLMMSVVMKHSSNITKLFIVASSALLTTILSLFILNISISWYFVVSFLFFILSLFLYYRV